MTAFSKQPAPRTRGTWPQARFSRPQRDRACSSDGTGGPSPRTICCLPRTGAHVAFPRQRCTVRTRLGLLKGSSSVFPRSDATIHKGGTNTANRAIMPKKRSRITASCRRSPCPVHSTCRPPSPSAGPGTSEPGFLPLPPATVARPASPPPVPACRPAPRSPAPGTR
jgi:hypothetical protein